MNSFFKNLRNNNKKEGKYEGLWAGLTDDDTVWIGARNSVAFGRWDNNNPQLLASEPLRKGDYYLVMDRMDAGLEKVKMDLFINESIPVASGIFLVNNKANPSKISISQKRDAIEHPGKESFDEEIARFLFYERPLSTKEL